MPLADRIYSTLQFEYVNGEVSRVKTPVSFIWHATSFLVCCQLRQASGIVEYSGGKKVTIGLNDAYVVPPNAYHQTSILKGGEVICPWAYFRLTVLHGIDAFSFFEVPRSLTGRDAKTAGDLCEEMAALWKAKKEEGAFATSATIKSLGFKLAEIILKASRPIASSAERYAAIQRLTPVVAELERRPGERLSLKGLATLVDLSPSRFSALFHAAFGVSPVRYQREARVARAQHLLLKEERSIKEIADELGFSDQFKFSRTFKKVSGESPQHFRTQARNRFMSA
jgi:AraC-like DNA-binding protein